MDARNKSVKSVAYAADQGIVCGYRSRPSKPILMLYLDAIRPSCPRPELHSSRMNERLFLTSTHRRPCTGGADAPFRRPTETHGDPSASEALGPSSPGKCLRYTQPKRERPWSDSRWKGNENRKKKKKERRKARCTRLLLHSSADRPGLTWVHTSWADG
jgi:hypothetical protein